MKDEVSPQTKEFIKDMVNGIYWRVLGDTKVETENPGVMRDAVITQSIAALNPYDSIIIVPDNIIIKRYEAATAAEYVADKLEPYEIMRCIKLTPYVNVLKAYFDTETIKVTVCELSIMLNKLEVCIKELPHLMQFLPITVECFTNPSTEGEPFMTLNFVQGSEKANKVRTINIA